MIIIDFQQVMISNILMQMGGNSGEIQIPLFKHFVLNSLLSYKRKYAAEYGEIVIATDTGYSWRKSAFQYYKANRSKDKETSTLDWEGMFEGFNQLKADIAENFPYRIIQVDGAEADDVIGVLCRKFGTFNIGGQKILILSGDKDFKQLQRYENVEQYDPVKKKKLVENNPNGYLIDHIISGDTGDGIPNILSSDNTLVIKQRQNTVTAKRSQIVKDCIMNGDWSTVEADDKLRGMNVPRNYVRNKLLIDLDNTPTEISDKIIDQFNAQEVVPRGKVFNYLMKNKMRNLMEFAGEF